MASSHFHDRLLVAAEETVSGAFHLFWGGSLAAILSAVCAILVARLLGPELYGIYSLTLIVPGFLTLFTDYGVSQALTRFIALYKSRGEGTHIILLLRVGLIFNILTCLIMFTVGFILTEPLTVLLINRPEIASLVRLTLILILLQPLSSATGCALLGFGDVKKLAIIDVIRQAIRTIVSPLLIVLGFSVFGALVGYILAFMIGTIISLVLALRCSRSIEKPYLNPGLGRVLLEMLSYGLPLYLSSILGSFTATLRGVILAYFTTNVLIGNFHTAMNFTILITLISSPIATVLFPIFSKLRSSEASIMFTYSVKYTSSLIIPVAVFVAVMSRDLVFLFYGVDYSYAPLYLALYALSFLFVGFGLAVLGSFFSGIGDSKVNLKATLLSVGIFIPSAVALTGTMRVEGMLTAIILATASSTIYSLWVATRKYSLRIDLKSSVNIYFATLLAVAPIIPIALYSSMPSIVNLTLAAILYLVAYLTVIPLLKVLTREDLENLTRIFSKVVVIQPIVKIISSYESKIMELIDMRNKPSINS
ncbi:MAG: oligosaccharide flippase family protein [Candidatus Methanomethylicia archaeon]